MVQRKDDYGVENSWIGRILMFFFLSNVRIYSNLLFMDKSQNEIYLCDDLFKTLKEISLKSPGLVLTGLLLEVAILSPPQKKKKKLKTHTHIPKNKKSICKK